MRILVTGSSGFIGHKVANRLSGFRKNIVTAVSNTSGNKVNKSCKVIHPGLTGVDLSVIDNQDIIFHLAANNDTLSTDRDEMWKANVTEPLKLLERAAKNNTTFVYASSCSVYGNSPVPYNEDSTPLNPLNLYAESKLAFDNIAMSFAKEYPNMNIVGLRFSNVYGPGEKYKGKRMSMISQMIESIMKKEKIILFKDGEQKRDWVYVDDIAFFYENIVEDLKCKPKTGVYNIGYGQAVSFNEIAYKLIHLYDAWPPAPQYIDNPCLESYQSNTLCDITKAKKDLYYWPCNSVMQSLAYNLNNWIYQ